MRDREMRLKDHVALVEFEQRIVGFRGFRVPDIHAEPGKPSRLERVDQARRGRRDGRARR